MRTPRQRLREMQRSRRRLNAPRIDVSTITLPPAPVAGRTAAPRPPVCDRSGDIGSKHIWREGAQHGDLCLCGKRSKVVLNVGK